MLSTDVFLRHYTRYLGKPFDVQTFRAEDDAAIRVATFDQRFKQFKVYASLGLSEQKEKIKDLGEVILLTDDFRPDVKQLFVHFLFFILQKKIPLGSRFSIGGIEVLNHDFADYYQKTGLYVMPADGFGPGFEEFDCLGETAHVYQGLFVSYAEQDFLRRSGPDAFEERLKRQEGQETELCALQRPSCV